MPSALISVKKGELQSKYKKSAIHVINPRNRA